MSPVKFAWHIVASEALIVNLESGDYYSVDPLGTSILLALENGQQPEQIAEDLARRYGVPTAREDVHAFIEQLEKEELHRLGQLAEEPEVERPETYQAPKLRKYDQLTSVMAYSPDDL